MSLASRILRLAPEDGEHADEKSGENKTVANNFYDVSGKIRRIKQLAGEHIVEMAFCGNDQGEHQPMFKIICSPETLPQISNRSQSKEQDRRKIKRAVKNEMGEIGTWKRDKGEAQQANGYAGAHHQVHGFLSATPCVRVSALLLPNHQAGAHHDGQKKSRSDSGPGTKCGEWRGHVPGEEGSGNYSMEGVNKGRTHEPAAKNQEGAALPGVITNQGHGACNKRQQCCDGLKQGMKFGGTFPTAPVKQETPKEHDGRGKTIDPAPSESLA